MNIILYLLQLIQYQHEQICWFLNFICRYLPLRQWAFDDSHSPKYQKFKIDELPLITDFRQDWSFKDLIPYYEKRYGKKILPIRRRSSCDISDSCCRPRCDAPKPFLYKNNGSKRQLLCKVCDSHFSPDESRFSSIKLRCPHCSNTLVPKKNRKYFVIHKCVNSKCPYYLHNLKKVDKQDLKHNQHVMSLCLTYRINLGLSLRKTAQALKDIHGIAISHQQVANYCKTASICVKPFVDHYDYAAGKVFTADETYIKVRGIKTYIWFIMDAAKCSIIGYQVSDNRGVDPCILAMRMAFRHLKELSENFKFIADGYSAYPLAAQQFFHEYGNTFKFNITHRSYQ